MYQSHQFLFVGKVCCGQCNSRGQQQVSLDYQEQDLMGPPVVYLLELNIALTILSASSKGRKGPKEALGLTNWLLRLRVDPL